LGPFPQLRVVFQHTGCLDGATEGAVGSRAEPPLLKMIAIGRTNDFAGVPRLDAIASFSSNLSIPRMVWIERYPGGLRGL
jgi:hypothetical protein